MKTNKERVEVNVKDIRDIVESRIPMALERVLLKNNVYSDYVEYTLKNIVEGYNNVPFNISEFVFYCLDRKQHLLEWSFEWATTKQGAAFWNAINVEYNKGL